MEFPIIDAALDDYVAGQDGLAIVDEPAIEEEMISHQHDIKLYQFKEGNRYLTGPVLIPGQLILRKHPDTGQYFYLRYSKEVIKDLRDKFFENGFHNRLNLNHDSTQKIDATIVQSQISEEDSNGLPAGTLYVTVKPKFKLTDEFLAKFRGFSIEAHIKLKHNNNMQVKQELLIAKLSDGTGIVQDESTLEIQYEADMNPLPDGEYELEDKTIIKVVNGLIQKEEIAEDVIIESNDNMEMMQSLVKRLDEMEVKLSSMTLLIEAKDKEIKDLSTEAIMLKQSIVKFEEVQAEQDKKIAVIGKLPIVEETIIVKQSHTVSETAHMNMVELLKNRNKK